MNHITKNGCKGCQWEETCEFDCPCDFHSGRGEFEPEESHQDLLKERAKAYSKIINDFVDWD